MMNPKSTTARAGLTAKLMADLAVSTQVSKFLSNQTPAPQAALACCLQALPALQEISNVAACGGRPPPPHRKANCAAITSRSRFLPCSNLSNFFLTHFTVTNPSSAISSSISHLAITGSPKSETLVDVILSNLPQHQISDSVPVNRKCLNGQDVKTKAPLTALWFLTLPSASEPSVARLGGGLSQSDILRNFNWIGGGGGLVEMALRFEAF